MEKRALRMTQRAQALCDQESQRAFEEGILEGSDLPTVFAVACAMSAVRMKSIGLASEVASSAIRTLIKNLMVHGIDIDLMPE